MSQHAGLLSKANLMAITNHAGVMPTSWSPLAHGPSKPSPSTAKQKSCHQHPLLGRQQPPRPSAPESSTRSPPLHRKAQNHYGKSKVPKRSPQCMTARHQAKQREQRRAAHRRQHQATTRSSGGRGGRTGAPKATPSRRKTTLDAPLPPAQEILGKVFT